MNSNKVTLAVMAFTIIGLMSGYWLSMLPIMATDLVSDDTTTVVICTLFIIIGIVMSSICGHVLTGIKKSWDYITWLENRRCGKQ